MDKAEKTRKYIIEKAAPIFNKHGYAGTSLSEIIDAIGLTKGAIYGNFKNKDEIALEALAYNYDNLSEKIADKVKTEKNSCNKLKAFAAYHIDNFDEITENGGCPILNAAVDSDDGNPLLQKKVLQLTDDWENNIVKLVERGIKRGEIKKETDAVQFATIFIATIEGGLMLSNLTGNREYVARVVEHIKEIIENSLRI
ncbi:MAG: TetR/AcrR family transcriptional regulator [bacterium]|nr:TetR/AcrR family transcriptional regulator [bacterium]